MATTTKTIENDQVVDQFLAAIEAGGMPAADLFGQDAILDATVPNWRFAVNGGEAVRSELAALVRRRAGCSRTCPVLRCPAGSW